MSHFDYEKLNIPKTENVEKVNNLKEQYSKSKTSIFDVPFGDLTLLLSFENAQVKGPFYEKYISNKLNGLRVPASKDLGDVEIDNNFFEIKVSTNNKGNKMNIRQIRLYQPINGYICAFINEQDATKSKFYALTSEQMKTEVETNGSIMHGTKAATKNNSVVEYGLSFPVYSKTSYMCKKME